MNSSDRDLEKVDLNALQIFDAVMAEQNMTRAANRLSMTPSAVSHAIARLKVVVNDELFVRTTNGVRPTKRAEELWSTIDKPMRSLQQALSRSKFNPLFATFTATLSLNDMLAQLIAPPIYARFSEMAPGLQISFRQRRPVEDEHRIATGMLDFAIGIVFTHSSSLRYQTLWTDEYCCLVRKDAVGGCGSFSSIEEVLKFPHVSVMQDGETPADLSWRDLGLVPRKRITVGTFSSVPEMVNSSNGLAILPTSYVKHITRDDKRMIMVNLPIRLEPLNYSMIWHERTERNEARYWFLKKLIAFCQSDIDTHLSLGVI